MSIEVYPADFSTRYELTHAIAIMESIRYNAISTIQITATTDDYNINMLRPGSVVYDTDREITYILVNVSYDTMSNYISANGYSANWLLNKRVVSSPMSIQNIESGVYALVSDNLRGLPRITLASIKGIPAVFQGDDASTQDVDESIVYGGQLADKVISVLDYGGLGHRMNWRHDSLSWEFEVYQGVDRTDGIHAVSFVEEQGTCDNLVVTSDESTFKNAAYCAVEKTDGTTETVYVGSSTGDERAEKWMESAIKQKNDETYDELIKRAKGELLQKLSEYISRSTFSVSVDPSEFGVLYGLGDVVMCSSSRFGVTFSATVTGVDYSMDIRGENTSVILGDTILTALGEMRLNG